MGPLESGGVEKGLNVEEQGQRGKQWIKDLFVCIHLHMQMFACLVAFVYAHLRIT